jgi:hypothetical protein
MHALLRAHVYLVALDIAHAHEFAHQLDSEFARLSFRVRAIGRDDAWTLE